MYGKRLILPEKWITPRFRKLTPEQKVVLSYLNDNCDWAGFLEIDTEGIAFHSGVIDKEIDEILNVLNEEEITRSNGWLFILDFIELQGNSQLNPNNNAHKNIIAKLNDNITYFKDCLRTQNNLAPYKEHIRGSSKSKGFCLGKDIDKSNSLGNNISNNENKDLKTKETEIPIKEKKVKIRYMNKGKCCDYCNAREYDLCKLESCRASDKDVFKELIKTPLK